MRFFGKNEHPSRNELYGKLKKRLRKTPLRCIQHFKNRAHPILPRYHSAVFRPGSVVFQVETGVDGHLFDVIMTVEILLGVAIVILEWLR